VSTAQVSNGQMSTVQVSNGQMSPAPGAPPAYASSAAGSTSVSSDPTPAPVAPVSAREG
jgi:hypothetical protein